jgi:hypothetical protein
LSPENDAEDLVLTPDDTDVIDLTHTPSTILPDIRPEREDDNRIPTERTPLLSDRKARTDSLKSTSTDSVVQSLNRTRLAVAISYASFSGILSGMCLIFAKSGVELLLLTIAGKNQFYRWETWVLLLGLVIFALLQLWYLHKALILADPTLVCPCTSFTHSSLKAIDSCACPPP